MSRLMTSIPPMEAESVESIPVGSEWEYEPKWDGFRCLAFRDGDAVFLQSKAQKPLGRYFPEVVAAIRAVSASKFVLDGEIAVPVKNRFAFDQLLQRIHPAESRIRKLSAEHPALFIVFDLLVDAKGKAIAHLPLRDRRIQLERFAGRYLKKNAVIRLSPSTTDLRVARKWLRRAGGNLDGVIAKRLDSPYRPGERSAMQKIKPARTADCVIGGFRYLANDRQTIGSLLLGLYDDEGLLHHVGFTSSFQANERAALTKRLEKLRKAPGFTGKAPGGPSRWSTNRSSDWQPVAAKLVIEVGYDQFSGGRFRHGTNLLRWRPDKRPRQCLLEQVERHAGADVRILNDG